MPNRSCCGHDPIYHEHQMDEVGIATEVKCYHFSCRGAVCASSIETPEGYRWLMADGTVTTHGAHSTPQRRDHTCGISDIPCAACVQEKRSHHKPASLRRALRMMGTPAKGLVVQA